MIKKTEYTGSDDYRYTLYEYDENGNCSSASVYDNYNRFWSKEEYTYNPR